MPTKIKNIYQFKIVLKDSAPKIWRRIQVLENYSFYQLHLVIQDAMGWDGDHMHVFQMKDPKTGAKRIFEDMEAYDFADADYNFEDDGFVDEAKAKISQYFSFANLSLM